MALLRVGSAAFGELRDALFAKVQQRAVRTAALRTFQHLHALSLRFHLDRQTGALARAIDRGSQGIQSVLRLAVFNVVPTVIELLLVTAIIWHLFDWRFAAITFGAVVSYVGFTMSFAGWRGAHPPHDERHRQRRLHQGARQPAELRDGEVFRQRGA